MRAIPFLSVMVAFLSSLGAHAAECRLPRGEVEFLEDLLDPDSGTEFAPKTRIEPNADCSGVRVWTYVPGKQGKQVIPTDRQCGELQGVDHSPFPSLFSCTDFKVYPSEEKAAGKKPPLAYLKAGALITRAVSGNTGGVFSAVYQAAGGADRVRGVKRFTLNARGSFNGGVGFSGGFGPGYGGQFSDKKSKTRPGAAEAGAGAKTGEKSPGDAGRPF